MQMNVNPNEDTEFHDALRAHGIIPPKAPSRSPSPEAPSAADSRAAHLATLSPGELDVALERAADARDVDAEEELRAVRDRRAAQLAREAVGARFGRVYPISRPDYTREVTEASKQDPLAEQRRAQGEEDSEDDDDDAVETGAGTLNKESKRNGKDQAKGTGVVCFLYKDGMETCQLLRGYLDTLAARYPRTKFVSIVGDKCIPNYPDRNLPTMLVYRNGELHRQIVGLRPEIGLDGMKTKCEDIELLLTAVGALDRSAVPGAPTHPDSVFARKNADEEDEEDGRDADEGFGSARRTKTAIRASVKTQEEEDAELDWD